MIKGNKNLSIRPIKRARDWDVIELDYALFEAEVPSYRTGCQHPGKTEYSRKLHTVVNETSSINNGQWSY
jgi:hypothetical protein